MINACTMLILKPIRALRQQISERPNLKRVGINSGWLLGDKLFRMCIGILVGAWVARYLGPTLYGKLAYVIAFLGVFQAFALLGLDSIVIRDLAQNTIAPQKILGTVICLRIFSSILAISAACLLAYILHPDNIELLRLVILVSLGIFFQVSDVFDLWFQSQSQSKRTVLAKGIAYLSSAAAKITLILTHAPLWYFAIAQSGEVAISAIVLYVSYKRQSINQQWVCSFRLAIRLLRQSWPLLLSGMSIMVYMRCGLIMLKHYVDGHLIGIYSSAQSLSELWYFLPMTVIASIAPIIARKKLEGQDVYIKALQNLFALMWFISLSISVIVAIFSQFLVTTLYGLAYENSATVLSIHIFTLVPVCIGVAQSIWLINENKSILALQQAVIGAISSIGLNYLLIPKYGLLGAAAAIVISQFTQAFLVNFIFAPLLFKVQINALISLPLKIWQVTKNTFK